jgi:protein-L-isoaspartate(D-aspartate) O-methyltransferase
MMVMDNHAFKVRHVLAYPHCRLVIALIAACGGNVETTSLPSTATSPAAMTPEADSYASTREAMVSEQIAARGVRDAAVLEAMRRVPRDRFVLPEHLGAAYEDHPLPIGHGQTISQPYIVALMTEALAVKPGDRVLEVGTGSGYQAAILAELGTEVYTVEIIPELAEQAATRLRELGYANATARQADGYFGWEERALRCHHRHRRAPDHLPQPLTTQLKRRRLVIPSGRRSRQTLTLRQQGGELNATNLGGVLFVPLTG